MSSKLIFGGERGSEELVGEERVAVKELAVKNRFVGEWVAMKS